jgi:hypothetical protein
MNVGGDEYFLRRGDPGTALLEIRHPLYPGMGVMLDCLISVGARVQVLPQGGTLTMAGADADDVRLYVAVFADSAPAVNQEFRLAEIDTERSIGRMLEQEIRDLRYLEPRFRNSPPRGSAWS